LPLLIEEEDGKQSFWSDWNPKKLIAMTSRSSVKTTFEARKTIEPIYTGGDVSWDRNGRLLATCVEEEVLIVDIETGKHVFRIENDGEPITSLALSPSASHLVVCSRSSAMRIYGLTGSLPDMQRSFKPHSNPVITSTIDDTGTLLATGGADGVVKVWDIRGGFSTHTFHGHGGIISALCFFTLASQHIPKQNGKRRRRGNDEEQDVSEGPGVFLASASDDGKIRIWNLQTRRPVASLDSHVSVVKSIRFSDHQQALLSASRDKTIILWDVYFWRPREVIPVLEVVEAAGFIADGTYFYIGGESGKVRVWSTSPVREITREQIAGNENDSIISIQQGPSSLLSVHLDQTIRIHDLDVLGHTLSSIPIDPLPIRQSISGNHDEIIDLAMVGHDRSLVAVATNTESIRIISIADCADSTGEATLSFNTDVALLAGHTEIVLCIDVDWSGHWLATGAKDNSARLWRMDPSTSSYTCFASFVGHAESLGAVALPRSPSSSQTMADPLSHPPAFLMTASEDRTIKRWEIPKLGNLQSLPSTQSVSKSLYTRVAHEKDINALDVSPTSSLFASASQDKTIKIWDLESGSVTGILRGHKRGVWSIRFAPKDAPPINTEAGGSSKGLLASGSGDRTVKLWSLSTYTCILTLEGHSNSVLKVLWLSPPPASTKADDHIAHSAGQIPHHTHPIIASASSDTLIKLWSPYASASSSSIDLAEDHLLATLDNHTDRVWALATPTTACPTTSHNTNSKTKPHPSSSSLSSIQGKYPLISGSADSRLTLWTDTTVSTLETVTALAAARVEQDQELQNHIRAQNHREVITLALELNHPEVNDVLSHLSHTQLYSLLLRVRDWNTNARTSPVAQRILHVILSAYPLSTFTDMARNRHLHPSNPSKPRPDPVGNMADLLRALEAYTDRHLRRTEELADHSYLIEYTLSSMDEVLGGTAGDETAPRSNGTGADHTEDVEMTL
jgi:U3 small nucleolar RNA-associated protein 13